MQQTLGGHVISVANHAADYGNVPSQLLKKDFSSPRADVTFRVKKGPLFSAGFRMDIHELSDVAEFLGAVLNIFKCGSIPKLTVEMDPNGVYSQLYMGPEDLRAEGYAVDEGSYRGNPDKVHPSKVFFTLDNADSFLEFLVDYPDEIAEVFVPVIGRPGNIHWAWTIAMRALTMVNFQKTQGQLANYHTTIGMVYGLHDRLFPYVVKAVGKLL